MKALWLALALLFVPAIARGQALQSPQIGPAIDGILAAFKNSPLVGMQNHEGPGGDLAQQQDFYAAIVRDPRFAREVGNVVVEFGAASAQPIIDRYIEGRDVPYSELRKVWTDTLGWSPPPVSLGYVNLFAQIRAVNLALPQNQRIRIWLGEPPIIWSKITKRSEIAPPGVGILQIRDDFVANLLDRQILSRGRKALVIYGDVHLLTDLTLMKQIPGFSSMASIVQRKHPSAFYNVATYRGFASKDCDLEFERGLQGSALPTLLAPIRGTALDDRAFRIRCQGGRYRFPPELSDAVRADLMDRATNWNADAILYLGPAASLTASPILPDVYLDGPYQREILRRQKLKEERDSAADLEITVESNPASPRPFNRGN